MKKILIANRGEIALRIIRACRDAGYASVAIASDADRDALHARMADEAHSLPGTSPRETYLNQAAILEIAERSGADAVHPGYGFLAENESFAAAVIAAGLTWIGPSPEAIARLGDKVAARALAREAGTPLLPSLEGDLDAEQAPAFMAEHGLPVIVKAQNGGGGRGMRIVRSADQFDAQLAAAQREAGLAFGRPECFIERYIEHARHIETQCLCDAHGGVLVLSTRDCTLQRRQQKLVEEAPAPFLAPEQEEVLAHASRRILKLAGYRGAATCEFLLTPEGQIYFLEVNTRVQVEHPVTEEVTGVDIIREMFRIAEGEALETAAPPITRHAIEFRLNAEDARADFRPTPGVLSEFALPSGPGVRVDAGYRAGDTVPPHYDSLMAKVIVSGATRREALERARRALGEVVVKGVVSLLPLHRAILERDEFAAESLDAFTVHTRWIDENLPELVAAADAAAETAAAFEKSRRFDGTDEISAEAEEEELPTYRYGVKAPLSGVVIELRVSEGDTVSAGDMVAVMEAMKMEQPIYADQGGTVASIRATVGGFVEMDTDILGLD